MNLPNLHVNVHLPDHARNYGTLVNAAVGVKEMVHRVFKGMVPHLNRKNVELDLTRRYNTQQALRHLADGGFDPRFVRKTSALQLTDSVISSIAGGWHVTETEGPAEGSDDDEDNLDEDGKEHNEHGCASPIVYFLVYCTDTTRTACHVTTVSNIRLHRQWTGKRATTAGWPTKLLNDHPLYLQLFRAYHRQGSAAALVNRKLIFYDGVSYAVRDRSEPGRVRVNVGDIVDVLEGREGVAYAEVMAIICHKANDGRCCAFFVLDWFTATSETILGCPIYKRQRPNDDWQRIFPLDHVDHSPRAHFIHACTRTCDTEQHDARNRQYFRNEFLYRAV